MIVSTTIITKKFIEVTRITSHTKILQNFVAIIKTTRISLYTKFYKKIIAVQ